MPTFSLFFSVKGFFILEKKYFWKTYEEAAGSPLQQARGQGRAPSAALRSEHQESLKQRHPKCLLQQNFEFYSFRRLCGKRSTFFKVKVQG